MTLRNYHLFVLSKPEKTQMYAGAAVTAYRSRRECPHSWSYINIILSFWRNRIFPIKIISAKTRHEAILFCCKDAAPLELSNPTLNSVFGHCYSNIFADAVSVTTHGLA